MEKSKNILVVEDDSLLRDELAHALSEGGYAVSTAKSAEEALGIVRSEKSLDLIVLDVLMPGMGGLEMLKQLREGEPESNIPVLILSNLKEDSAIAEAIETGGHDYLVKADWTLDDVLEKVREKLG